MTSYELFHLSMKCIGIAFLTFVAIIVILMANAPEDMPDDDGERM